ncbi:MAG: AAA family ATPase [bacterium]|nr:AAA family ATPase [bacterium]
MRVDLGNHRYVIVVGSGGVGKTTLSAALALQAARAGEKTLVMTFDPSLRLKDTLGVGDSARGCEVPVASDTAAPLHASLIDARATFDRLIHRYAPDDTAAKRILENRFYKNLAGQLAGILEYMAVERLYELSAERRYDRIVLDTPPTRQVLDFLEAPERLIAFLDSGALRIALRPWFDETGHLRVARLPGIGSRFEAFLDRVIGLGLLRDMAEFFQAFSPLYDGFRERALEVRRMLHSEETVFVLVSAPGEKNNADTMFLARRLEEAGYRLGPVIVNRVHPRLDPGPAPDDPETAGGLQLMGWLGERDQRGVESIRALLPGRPLIALPMLPRTPSDLQGLDRLIAD